MLNEARKFNSSFKKNNSVDVLMQKGTNLYRRTQTRCQIPGWCELARIIEANGFLSVYTSKDFGP